MTFSFDRPVGAPADVAELDYVSALHQTDVKGGVRRDGSIQGEDLNKRLLCVACFSRNDSTDGFVSVCYVQIPTLACSFPRDTVSARGLNAGSRRRHLDIIVVSDQTDHMHSNLTHTHTSLIIGVQETPEQVREKILSGLGSIDGYMDMMQLVSLLLTPILRQEQEYRKQDSNRNEDNDLLVYTVEMMLHDVTGSRAPKPLTRTLIKQILQAYGETALCENDELVQQMLDQAGASIGERVLLNAETFCRALTQDVQAFNVENKDKQSTNFDDAMFGDSIRQIDHPTDQIHAEQAKSRLERRKSTVPTLFNEKTMVDDVPLIYTAPHLDNTADTFRSRPLVVFQWTFFVLSFRTYLFKHIKDANLVDCPDYEYAKLAENADGFFCQVGVNLLKWSIIMLAMSACGLLYFWLAGIGNFVECKNPLLPLIGTAFSCICTLLPWWLIGKQEYSEGDAAQKFLKITTYCLGGFTIFLGAWQFIALLIPKKSCLCRCCWDILVPEAVRTESRVKQASACKIDKMVANALEVHRVKKQETVVPTHFGQALLNFAESAPQFVRTGGLRWTWQMIFSRDLFCREGIMFSGRLLSSNFTQFLLIPFILIIGTVLTMEYDERLKEIINDYLEENLIPFDLDSIPESTVIRASLGVGTSIAFFTALTIALAVLPSATSTALKFRSGVIPFATDVRVRLLRLAPDQTALLKGIMFWGALYASLLAGGVVAVIIFLLFCRVTTTAAQHVLAMIVGRISHQRLALLLLTNISPLSPFSLYPTGALLVVLIHWFAVRSFRSLYSQAYYRKRPAVANLAVLTRECGLVALTQGFVIVRILKLLLATMLYLGRVDTPFLHSSRGQVGGFRMDGEPFIFQMDILQHEAHRHPYIETLGVMYLLKLRHGDNFCSLAGSCWRLIFVYVLMPWLSKYRAMRRPQVLPAEDETSNGAVPLPPPLRAVTLVDPQAYALRAVSLVPVASGWAGGSRGSLVSGRGWAEARGDSFEEREEIRELKGQVRKLQLQLQLQELNAASPPLRRDHKTQVEFDETMAKPGWEEDYEDLPAIISPQPQGLDQDDMVPRHSNMPPSARVYESDGSRSPALKRKKSEQKRQVQFDETLPKPGWEEDYEDWPAIHSPQPQGLDKDDMVPRHSFTPPSAHDYESDSFRSPPVLRRKRSKGLPTLRPPRQVSWATDVPKF